jgi:hypothetical protein
MGRKSQELTLGRPASVEALKINAIQSNRGSQYFKNREDIAPKETRLPFGMQP